MNEKRIVKPWQAGLMLLVGIAVIIAGLLVMKLNNRIVLALDGVIMCLMAWCFGIPYAELQQGIKETVSSMIVAILILLAVGVLVGAVIMVVGYSLGRAFIYATPEAALLKLPYQILQAAVGALVGTLLVWKCGLRKLFNEKLMK